MQAGSAAGAGADPGFFLGGGALVSCSTSTPINHIVFFFGRIPVVQVISGGGGMRTPCTLPLDPPLRRCCSSLNIQYIVACFSLSSSQYMRALFVPLYYVLCEVSRLAQLTAEHAILSLVISKLKDCFVFFLLFSIFLHKPCLERKLTAGNHINTSR